MSVSTSMQKLFCLATLSGLLVGIPGANTYLGRAQEELPRKVKIRVPATYPKIARRMNITGVVKIAVVVAPDGEVKSTKVMGGHPLLVNAALDAVKKWRFEPAAQQDTGIVEFKFRPED